MNAFRAAIYLEGSSEYRRNFQKTKAELIPKNWRRVLGLAALASSVTLAAFTLTAQSDEPSGVPTKITFEVAGYPKPFTMPKSYYHAIYVAGRICPKSISEAELVAQADVEDGTAFGWNPYEVSPAGAEGPAQFEEYTFTEDTDDGIISGGDIDNVDDAIKDMGQLDCYNAKKYDSEFTALEVYVSGRAGVDPSYPNLINQIASTVSIKTKIPG
jgi:hypothetical protein